MNNSTTIPTPRWHSLKLATRITIGSLTVLIAVAAAFVYTENSRIRNNFQHEQRAILEQGLHSEKLRLNHAIETLRQDALFLSEIPPVTGIIRATENHGYDVANGNSLLLWEKRMQQIFSAFSMAHSVYYQIRFIGVADNGREIVRINKHGEKIWCAPESKLQTKGDMDYFKATLALKKGHVYLSNFNLNREHDEIVQPHLTTLRASAPVFTQTGEIFGMVVIDMDAEQLLESAAMRLPPGTQTFIANSEGYYLLHPDAQQSVHPRLGEKSRITSDFPVLQNLVDSRIDYMPMRVMTSRLGDAYLAAEQVRFDSGNNERSLLLAYQIPASVVAQQMPSIPTGSLFAGFIMMLSISALLLIVLRRTFAPLQQITLAANKLAAGDDSVWLPKDGGDEIGILTDAFITMKDKLSSREQEILRVNEGLEQQVWARTNELKTTNDSLQVEIAERQRMLQETDRLLQFNHALMKNSIDGIHIMDIQGHIVQANDAFCRILGYTRDEITHLNVTDWDARWTDDELRMKFRELIGKNARFETIHRRKDGTLIDVEICSSGEEIYGQAYIFASSRDITERKRADEALRIAAATFESHEAILITDARANIIRVNRAFSEVTGFSAEDVIGRNPRMMSSGLHDREFYIELWQHLLHEGTWSGEIYDRRKNGQIYPKWMTITAVKNGHEEVTQYIAIFSDITARKQVEEEIRNLAFYDALTRLPNRRLFLDRFGAALSASSRHSDYGATLFIDLDRFKTLNDTQGHEYGDMLLKEIGGRIKSCVREMDTVARFGGDEFVVLIEALDNNLDDATHKVALIAEKIRDTLEQPYQLKDHLHHGSSSIGICLFQGNEETVDTLLERADMAMYQAKSSGRNSVRFFDPVMQQNLAIHDSLENDLHHAIALGQLQLHYQVQVDKDNHPLGAEAFLRWIHPEHGIVPPAQCIPIAEESSLIIDIGNWVLNTACERLARWSVQKKMRDLTLTINISAKQFAHPDFVKQVTEAIQTYRIDPSHLKMELSEKMVLADVDATVEKINALRNLGVRLSMDNFSTVYSSLSYLRQLSSDQIKIHQEFVQGITQRGNDAQLVQVIIDMAKSMNMNVFAEGVETEAQLDFLQSRNCTSYQGYLFGKPVAIDEFEALLDSL